MKIDRREMLSRAQALAVALSLPGWIAACRARESDVIIDDLSKAGEPLASAWRRARAARRPLLAFAVPADEGERYERGQILGVYLNRIDDEGLADLACVEIVCVHEAQLESFANESAGSPTGALLACLFEADRSPNRTIRGDVRPTARVGFDEEAQRQHEREVGERNRGLFENLRSVLAPDLATLERRARFERGEGADVEQAPQTARWLAESDGTRRAELIVSLAGVARHRYVDTATSGASWARSSGCGTAIEGREQEVLMACGMGHIPKISSRFLVFFADEEG